MENKRILVTGASGLVGSRIVKLLADHYEFITPSSDEFDITQPEQIRAFLAKHPVSYCLHLAAYTQVDHAETEIEEATRINVSGTKNLFDLLHENGVKGIYFSTDFVFDGQNPPYTEDATPHPISAYGRTKFEAEQAISHLGMIIRIAYPYRAIFPAKKDFVRTIHDLLAQGKAVSMISDASFTPTFIDDIAWSLPELIENYQPAIYHRVGSQTLSMYDAGRAIAEVFTLDASLISETSYDSFFAGKAQRPRYSEVQTIRPSRHQFRSFLEGLKVMKDQQENPSS